jgi:cation diffusion facilitator CzcD-associated flavoprotein CzcO
MSDAHDSAVLIVGAGFAGLGMAIRLKQAGIDFVVLEAAGGVGGTWRDNHYPGCACDVQSHLYSFSFEPWPRWTRDFAPQEEILEYLEHCTDTYDIRPHIRFGSRVSKGRFDEGAGQWELSTTDGRTFRARVVVSGTGPLSRPQLPDIPGLSSFEGKTFHSARWDDAFPLAGKSVAVIGTGASAIQIVPAIAPEVGKLFVYQRTPPWVMPKPDGPIPAWKQRLFSRSSVFQKAARARIYWTRELLALGFVVEPRILGLAEGIGRRYLTRKVADPALRAKLTPTYRLGCKRVVPSNDYLPALQRDNVELVTDGILEVRPHGIVTKDGAERAVDAIVLATGFEAAEQVAPFEVRGRDGRELNEVWRDGAEAYLGTTIAGFPNLFLLVGPNTGLGHSSMIFMIESQVAYVLDAIRTMRARGLKLVDLKPEAQQSYNARIQKRLEGTVWSSGCMSWYLTRTGKNTTIWPGFTFEFRRMTRKWDSSSYEVLADNGPRSALADARAPLRQNGAHGVTGGSAGRWAFVPSRGPVSVSSGAAPGLKPGAPRDR